MKDRLILVNESSELYSGMPVIVKAPTCCQKDLHCFFLDEEISRSEIKKWKFRKSDLPGWTTAGFVHLPGGGEFVALGKPMKDGRLFRIPDDSKSVMNRIVSDVVREINARSREIEAAYLEKMNEGTGRE